MHDGKHAAGVQRKFESTSGIVLPPTISVPEPLEVDPTVRSSDPDAPANAPVPPVIVPRDVANGAPDVMTRIGLKFGSLSVKLIVIVSTSLKASSKVICAGPISFPLAAFGPELPVITRLALPSEATVPVCAKRRSFDQLALVFPVVRVRFRLVEFCAPANAAQQKEDNQPGTVH
jgi:hypothetical protein